MKMRLGIALTDQTMGITQSVSTHEDKIKQTRIVSSNGSFETRLPGFLMGGEKQT
jgi:hypothetical protein